MNVDELVKQIAFRSCFSITSRFVRIIPSTPTAQTRITGRPAGVYKYKSPGDGERGVLFSLSFAPVLHIRCAYVIASAGKRSLKVFDASETRLLRNLVHITADIRRCRNSSLQKKCMRQE